jgi:hypothetical protein
MLMILPYSAILAVAAEQLQQLITCVDDWCCAHGMTISIVKSEVMVFNCPVTRTPYCECVSATASTLPVSRTFKYLGVWFHFQKGASAQCTQGCCSRGKFAIACMHRKLSNLDIGSNVNLPR